MQDTITIFKLSRTNVLPSAAAYTSCGGGSGGGGGSGSKDSLCVCEHVPPAKPCADDLWALSLLREDIL